MATITEILHTCKIDDKLTNGTLIWTVAERYTQGKELIVIAIPHDENEDLFELWSCGVENYSYMPNLRKI